ncbi:retrovirus-related pol polyprotein from transposon TNT 1-94 [Tanacetum coccineum]
MSRVKAECSNALRLIGTTGNSSCGTWEGYIRIRHLAAKNLITGHDAFWGPLSIVLPNIQRYLFPFEQQYDWLADTDEEINEQELEANYSYMAKIQDVPNAESGTNSEPLEQTQPNKCDNDIQDDQNDVECDDERVALANLIANLKLDVDENKKIQKQLKKANATLTQELTECKSILAETSRTLGESNSIRDSCLVALQNKQTEFERYKAFNDRTVDYDKLERVAHRTNVSRPQPRSNQMKDKVLPNTSQVKFKKTEVEDHPRISRISNQQSPFNLRIVQLILFIVDSGCTKHMTGNLSLLCNFVEKYLGTVRFGNDQFAPILGYRDLVQGNITINRVYYIEETTSSTLICLMAKASPTQAWLWHRRLSHLNFDYINLLSKKDVVIGLPKLKYVKDQLCSSCEVSKAKRSSFKSKTVPSSKGRLNLLHMDLFGPMRIESINGKKYILVIVDDYSRYTWTHLLRSKDETPKVLKDFLKMIQRNLEAQVITVRTDRDTKFLNKTLYAYFKEEGIEHQT